MAHQSFAWLCCALSLVQTIMARSYSASDFYVRELPGLPEGTRLPLMHAGNLPVNNETDDGLFFWSISSKYQVTEVPKTMIWLNGGPGCSSMDGAMLEMGPFRVDEAPGRQGMLKVNEGAWTDYVNMVFVDQPLGVGFSSPKANDFAKNITQASEQFVQFLKHYTEIFPEVLASEIYLGGESYAGQYLPYIWKSLQEAKTSQNFTVDVAGIYMGNPWLDPAHQYPSYAAFVTKHGLLEGKDLPGLDSLLHNCMDSLGDSSLLEPKDGVCDRMYQYISEHSMKNADSKCFNVYKYTDESPFPACGTEWPKDLPALTAYLSRPEVQQALNVDDPSQMWIECSAAVSHNFMETGVNASVMIMPEMLAEIPVMVTIGDLDFICNGLGLEESFKNMKWNGKVGLDEFVPTEKLSFAGAEIGEARTDRNLTVAHVYQGSHMLPVDLQFESRMLLHKFVGVTPQYDALEIPLNVTRPVSPGPTPSTPSQSDPDSGKDEDEISEATSIGYARAGVTALIVVAVVSLIVFVLWRRNGSGITFTGFIKALLHTGLPKRKPDDYIQLQNRNRPTDMIVEEEEDEFEV